MVQAQIPFESVCAQLLAMTSDVNQRDLLRRALERCPQNSSDARLMRSALVEAQARAQRGDANPTQLAVQLARPILANQ